MTKIKFDSHRDRRRLAFIALWGVSWVAPWIIITMISDPLYRALPSGLVFTILTILHVLVPAFLQVSVIERVLKHSMRGWFLYSILGALLTCISFVYTDAFSSYQRIALATIAMHVPVAVVQGVWLRRWVRAAWLWPFASATASIVQAHLFFFGNRDSDLLRPSVSLAYGLIMGSIMMYLLSHPKVAEKAKVDVATDEQSDETRLSRLQEQERSTPLWDIGDDQALQNEA